MPNDTAEQRNSSRAPTPHGCYTLWNRQYEIRRYKKLRNFTPERSQMERKTEC